MLHRSRICRYISRSSRLRFRMTASTAIESVFRCSANEGGTTTVAARNRRPRTRRYFKDWLRALHSAWSHHTPDRYARPAKAPHQSRHPNRAGRIPDGPRHEMNSRLLIRPPRRRERAALAAVLVIVKFNRGSRPRWQKIRKGGQSDVCGAVDFLLRLWSYHPQWLNI